MEPGSEAGILPIDLLFRFSIDLVENTTTFQAILTAASMADNWLRSWQIAKRKFWVSPEPSVHHIWSSSKPNSPNLYESSHPNPFKATLKQKFDVSSLQKVSASFFSILHYINIITTISIDVKTRSSETLRYKTQFLYTHSELSLWKKKLYISSTLYILYTLVYTTHMYGTIIPVTNSVL